MKTANDPCEISGHSYSWIDPQGHNHELRDTTHGSWALAHLNPDWNPARGEDESLSRANAQKALLIQGWIRVGNALGIQVIGNPTAAAWRTAAKIMVKCTLEGGRRRSASDTVIVQVDSRHNYMTVEEFVEKYGNRDLLDDLTFGKAAAMKIADMGVSSVSETEAREQVSDFLAHASKYFGYGITAKRSGTKGLLVSADGRRPVDIVLTLKNQGLQWLVQIHDKGGRRPIEVPVTAGPLFYKALAAKITKLATYVTASKAAKDKIPGGLAKGKQPSDFDQKALAKGQKVEMEHTEDPDVAREIAMDHLTEDPKYYDKLEVMEKEASDRYQKPGKPEVQDRLASEWYSPLLVSLPMYGEHLAKDFSEEKSLKEYLRDHPTGDPKNHRVVETEEGTKPSTPLPHKTLKNKVQEALTAAKTKAVDMIKNEAGEWKSVAKGIKKIVTRQPMEPEERRQVINYAIHQSLMFAGKSAIFSVVPPPPGYLVKQAISSLAFRFIDKMLGQKFGLKTAGGPEDIEGFMGIVHDAILQATDQVLSEYQDSESKNASFVRYAEDFPTQDAYDKYMKEHPDADPKNHRVVETEEDAKEPDAVPKKTFRAKVKDAITKASSILVDLMRDEAGVWANLGVSAVKVFKAKNTTEETRRELIGHVVNAALDVLTESAIYAVVPPPPGWAVKKAVGYAAGKILDKKLNEKYEQIKEKFTGPAPVPAPAPARTAEDEVADFANMVLHSIQEATEQVMSKYKDTEAAPSPTKVALRYVRSL